ncbi:MAG TPA: substrate-binding domain-containing protein [Acetobacteraceae bacterium]|nr:substrate-binding domain-containing protein [Acetobacteraceae bacterium]
MTSDQTEQSRATTRRRLLRAGALSGAGLAGATLLARPWVARAARRLSIAVIPKSLDNSVFYYAHYGAQKRAKELGDVDVIWTASTTSDANQEAQVLTGLVTRHVNGMAVDANAPQPLMGPIAQAVAQGIKVITWDSDVPDSKRQLFYGVDSNAMGQKLAEETVKAMGTSGTVILVSGGPGATNLNARLKGATDTLAKYPNIKTMGPFFHDDDLVKAQQLTNNLLVSHPDAGAILMVAGVPFFGKMSALPAVMKNQGRVKIITTDVLAPELPFVKDGYVQALVGQDYWGWGYQSVSILYNLLTNSKCQYPALVPQNMPVVTAANVDDWIKRWKQAATPAGAAAAFKEPPIGCAA